MSDPILWHRLQFAFTITYHYLFPQLTMGLALLIVVLKAIGLAHRRRPRAHDAARFWIRIFGLNFAVGVVTGIPMEFQFGTNWASFSRVRGRRHRADAGDGGDVRVLPRVAFLGAARLRRAAARPRAATSSPRWRSSPAAGSPATSSSRPTPSCSTRSATPSAPTARCTSRASGRFLLNPWALAQYAHNMAAAVVTGVVRGGRRRRVLRARGPARRRRRASSCARASSPASSRRCSWRFRPATCRPKLVAASPARRRSRRWRGASRAGRMAGITLIGQPNVAGAPARQPDHGARRCSASSRTARSTASVRGLDDVPRGPVARQHRAALLRVPRDGRASGRCSSR